MKTLKIVKFFESIPKINTYSHCGSSLDKMFKMNSLKYFIKTLKFKEEFHKKYLKEKSFDTKKVYDIYEMEGMKNKKINYQEEDIFALPIKKSTKIIKNNNNQSLNKSYFYHKKSHSIINDSPDSLKYNPNYNSISKNIPAVKIVKPSTNKRRINKNNFLNDKMQKEISKIMIKDDIIKKNKMYTINNSKNAYNERRKNNNNLDSDKLLLGKEQRFLTQIYVKNNSINNNNKFRSFYKNHTYKKDLHNLPSICTEYPHYMLDTKSIEKKTLKDNTQINNQINNNTISFHNKNKAVDFEKMQSRSNKFFINLSSLKVPNTGYYEPKYNCVEKKIINISLNRPVMDTLKKKQLLLKKIMTSYHMESKFLLVDNSKLNDETLKKLNL